MANGGISDEDKEDIGVDRTPNPYRDTLMDYSFVGSSLLHRLVFDGFSICFGKCPSNGSRLNRA